MYFWITVLLNVALVTNLIFNYVETKELVFERWHAFVLGWDIPATIFGIWSVL